MTLFRGEQRDVYGSPTYNPFNNPSLPLASVAFDQVYGLLQRQANASGETVTVDKALALPTVWRCVGLLATVIASCPLTVYKDPDKKLVRVPVLDLGNFTTTYTPFELWELITAHVALWGNAFIRKVRDRGGAIVDLLPIPPELVDVKQDASGHKIFLVLHHRPDGSVVPDKEVATDWEIMHLPGLGYDGLRGLSPLQVAAQTYGTSLAADRLAAKFFANGTQLSGVINVKAPLTSQTQADEIKRRWMNVNAGVSHAGMVAVLDAETTFQPLTIPPDTLQFLESRQWQTEELARMYGIPPHLIGDMSKSTSWGSGIEQQNMAFVAYTVGGWTIRFQQRVTREIVRTRGQYSAFDLTELMRGSMTERFTGYAQAIQWGWMTRNEARIREDMKPLKGLDDPLTPLNMVSGTTGLLANGALPGAPQPLNLNPQDSDYNQ